MVANNIEAWLLEHFSELSSRIDDVLENRGVSLNDPAKLALACVQAQAEKSSGPKITSETPRGTSSMPER